MKRNTPSIVPFEIIVSNAEINFEIIYTSDVKSSKEAYMYIPIQARVVLSPSSFVANESVNIDDELKVVNNS